MNHSMPGLPVYHQLLEFTQTHVHQVGDAIQPSHPLSSPSPLAPNLSQHQDLFQWVNSSHELAKVLEFQLQHQSFQWTPKTYLLQSGLVGSPCSPRDAQESSPTPQFKRINSSVLSFLHSATLTSILTRWTFVDKVMFLLFNMLSRLAITFLPRSKCLLISWLQSPSAVILEPPKIKTDTVSTVSPYISHEVVGPDAVNALVIANTLFQQHKRRLHMDVTRWSTLKSDWLHSLQPKMEKLYSVSKNKIGSWLWHRSWTPYCLIQT